MANTTEIWLMSLIILTSMVILFVTIQLSAALKRLSQGDSQAETKENRSWWENFTGLRPIEEEKDLAMEHQYDGIVELDNPTPPWFMYLFYLTILFGIIYGINYHVLQDGNLQDAEYKEEVAIAEKAREAYMKKFANSVNEDNVTALTAAKDITEGSEIYKTNCVACHGDKGQGGVGPNLTDNFWLHGGNVKALFHTITNGVPEKGMIAWNKTLNPIQIQKVSSFILSIKGTNPAGAKEPQGTEEK
ncbi:cbb3-type cytochrome c oxidase N-terminal domain-containing protein [Aquirufa sp. ROCK-SH2]